MLEVDPPKKLVMTFHARWSPEIEAEGPVTHTWAIQPDDDGTCKLTVTTSGLAAGSRRATEFGDGMAYIVSGLKSFVETGEPLVAA